MFKTILITSNRVHGISLITAISALFSLPGCLPYGSQRFGRSEEHGRTYYIDGAGNWGFGVTDVRDGLRSAGYQGQIVNFYWSPTFNPLLDQTIGRPFAYLRGAALAREIDDYLQAHPNSEVNIIALSAGTGVAIWGCEQVQSTSKIHNVLLLSSSLASTYDLTKALNHVSGRVYVYTSHADFVLSGPVRTLGTIDGRLGVEPAGIAGLKPPTGMEDRVVNVPWNSSYRKFGWSGSHVDGTSTPFVQHVLSRYILPAPEPAQLTSLADGPRQ